MATEYPIDTSVLDKGTYIPPGDVEAAYGRKRSHKHYGLSVLRLRKYIRDRLAERGLHVVTKAENDGIRILEDSASVAYTNSMFRRGLRAAMRAHDDGMRIDQAKLNSAERDSLDRNMDRQGRILQAVHKASGKMRRLKVSPTTQGGDDGE